MQDRLRSGELEGKMVEVDVPNKPSPMDLGGGMGPGQVRAGRDDSSGACFGVKGIC